LQKLQNCYSARRGFAYASDVADLSLQTDSSNVRAQFVKAALAPILVHKGIFLTILYTSAFESFQSGLSP